MITSVENNDQLNTHLDELEVIMKRLEYIREQKKKGNMIRSRARLSKYFLNLEKRNYINKSIPSFTIIGKNITDSQGILQQQYEFYSSLYASKGVENIFTGDLSPYMDNMKKLTDLKKEQLEAPYTNTELEEAIKSSKLNKAPGPYMFSNEFFKSFLDNFGSLGTSWNATITIKCLTL